MLTRLAVIFVCYMLGGCAADINQRTAENYVQAGHAAIRAGNWNAALQDFSRAMVNADLGHLDDDQKARFSYEYGRALGVTCHYPEAEKYLTQSKALAQQANHSSYLPLYELGLLHEAQGKPAAALDNFAELVPQIERENLESRAPLGVADIYMRYAKALDATGKPDEAADARKKSETLISGNPNAMPLGSPTPYGTVCSQAA
ncbi:tetratricopeptide repeat protein [Undibacterium sp.]|uniref:tetratricopeptide repeat protein n=1 Tax=Undibacterium sp. TaxID=1914977 RepID=UPI00374D4270